MAKDAKKKKQWDGMSRLLGVEESAGYLGISPRTIYNGIGPKAKKRFPVRVKRMGKLVKFDIRDLDAYIDSM